MTIDDRIAFYTVAVKELTGLLGLCKEKDVSLYITSYRHVFDMQTLLAWDDLVTLQKPDRDYRLIIKTIDQAVKSFPDNIWLRCFRARALWGSLYFHCAVEDLEYALQQEPYNTLAQLLYGETLFMLKKYRAALIVLERVALRTPLYARVYVARGLTYSALSKRYENTQKHYYRVLAYMDFEHAIVLQPQLACVVDKQMESLKKEIELF